MTQHAEDATRAMRHNSHPLDRAIFVYNWFASSRWGLCRLLILQTVVCRRAPS